MAVKQIKVTGVAYWAKLFERNRDQSDFHEETDGITSIDVVLDQEQLEALKEAGSRLRPKVTDEGLVVKFRRPWNHKSVEEFGGQAQVVNIDNENWDTDINIGNGSTVEVAADVYDTPMGKGTRLTGVKVIELEEFEGAGQPRLPF